MQTTTTPPPPVLAAPPRRPRLTLLWAGVIGLGAIAGTGGVGVLAAFGSDGAAEAGPYDVSTGSVAVISDVSGIGDTASVGAVIGRPQIRVSAEPRNASDEVFVGIGRAEDVDRYLADVAHEEVTDAVGSVWGTGSPRPGADTAAPPGSQTIWVASGVSTGDDPLAWDLREGDYRLVVMNGDGSASVDARLELAFALDQAYPLGLGLLAAGGVTAAAGTVLLARSVRRPR